MFRFYIFHRFDGHCGHFLQCNFKTSNYLNRFKIVIDDKKILIIPYRSNSGLHHCCQYNRHHHHTSSREEYRGYWCRIYAINKQSSQYKYHELTVIL